MTITSETFDFIKIQGLHHGGLLSYLSPDRYAAEPMRLQDNVIANYSEFSCVHLSDLSRILPHEEYLVTLSGCSYSDYSGSLVEAANFDYIKETYLEKIPGLIEIIGSHGSHSIGITIETIDAYYRGALPSGVQGLTKSLIESLDSMLDYPLLCENTYDKVREEAKEEAWDCWIRLDLIRGLESQFEIEIDSDDQDSKLQALTHAAISALNLEWRNESGDTLWIDIEQITKSITLEQLQENGVSYSR